MCGSATVRRLIRKRPGWSYAAGTCELLPVDLAGHDAWVLAADESALRSATPIRGIRLLVASDLRLLGQDRAQLFVGPGKNDHSPLQDWFHPDGLVVKGRMAGAWGRRGGKVSIKAVGPMAPSIRKLRPATFWTWHWTSRVPLTFRRACLLRRSWPPRKSDSFWLVAPHCGCAARQ
jgi:hypothetical protein